MKPPRPSLLALALAASVPAAGAHAVDYQLFTVKGAELTIARDFAPGGRVVGYTMSKSAVLKGFEMTRTGRSSSFAVDGALSTTPYASSGSSVLGQATLDFSLSGTHGFVLAQDGTVTLIDVPGGSSTAVYGMNAAGTIVGSFAPPSGAEESGFVLAGGSYTRYDVPGAFDTDLSGITDAGVLIGSYRLWSNGNVGQPFVGFIDDGHARTDVRVPGAFDTVLTGINAQGWLCGYFDVAGTQGFKGYVFDGSTYTQIAPPGATSTYVWHLRDDGRVVGFSYFADGSEASFIATLHD